MALIQIIGITKKFEEATALNDINLTIGDGEFAVFVGPSGCGKTTLLRIIAGLETSTAGKILIDGDDVTMMPASKRGLSMVFQSYALYPHMNVWKNMAFGLKMAKCPADEIEHKVAAAAEILQLKDHLTKKPGQLSGGQRQRVAIGRAIVREPRGFLFDEPLSNLDAALRVQMRLEIVSLQRKLGTTAIYVTHDQVEAMTMASTIVVLNAGKVEQVGSALDIYNNPTNRFVAGFIGSPKMNFIEGKAAAQINPKAQVLGIRPEHLVLTDSNDSEGMWSGVVENAEHLGCDTFLYIRCEQVGLLVARISDGKLHHPDEKVSLKPLAGRIHLFDENNLSLAAK